MKEKIKFNKLMVIALLFCFLLSVATVFSMLYTIGYNDIVDKIFVDKGTIIIWIKNFLKLVKKLTLKNRLFQVRLIFIFIGLLFIAFHLFYPIKKIYIFLFKHRWIIGLIILCVLTVFKIHGDSMTLYDAYIQPGEGTQLVQPIFGEGRAIRSDEWVVNTPNALSSSYGEHPYGKYNSVLRGGNTLNLVAGVNFSYSTIAKNPAWFAYKLFGAERGFCFCWNFIIIYTFLISVELCYIITHRNKLISAFGGVLIVLSSYFMWWSFPVFIAGSASAIVCIYYFLIARNKKLKFFYAMGVAVSTANFVVNLYPAWQVPMGYVIIAFLFWLLHDYWRLVKAMDYKDWSIFCVALLFCVSLIVTYMYDTSEYTKVIMQTVYPGVRFDSGGFALNKLMYYGQSLFYGYKEVANCSESGVFFSLFPIPLILIMFHQLRAKKKDCLSCGLLVVGLLLSVYCSVGLPPTIAKYTLMSYSTSHRAVDILGLVNVFLLIILLGRVRHRKYSNVILGLPVSCVIGYCAVLYSSKLNPNYMTIVMAWISITVIVIQSGVLLIAMKKEVRNFLIIVLIIFFSVSSAKIRPIMLGFDAIYSKPVAKEIQTIMEEDDNCLWMTISDDIVLQGYAVACGAPTLNSVNIYPNLDMWRTLDPVGKYNDVYNRFAHITVNLNNSETKIELVQADWVKIDLLYSDLSKLGVDYLLSRSELESNTQNIRLDKIYNEAGLYIYKVYIK